MYVNFGYLKKNVVVQLINDTVKMTMGKSRFLIQKVFFSWPDNKQNKTTEPNNITGHLRRQK